MIFLMTLLVIITFLALTVLDRIADNLSQIARLLRKRTEILKEYDNEQKRIY